MGANAILGDVTTSLEVENGHPPAWPSSAVWHAAAQHHFQHSRSFRVTNPTQGICLRLPPPPGVLPATRLASQWVWGNSVAPAHSQLRGFPVEHPSPGSASQGTPAAAGWEALSRAARCLLAAVTMMADERRRTVRRPASPGCRPRSAGHGEAAPSPRCSGRARVKGIAGRPATEDGGGGRVGE